jgi:hypothetical protein
VSFPWFQPAVGGAEKRGKARLLFGHGVVWVSVVPAHVVPSEKIGLPRSGFCGVLGRTRRFVQAARTATRLLGPLTNFCSSDTLQDAARTLNGRRNGGALRSSKVAPSRGTLKRAIRGGWMRERSLIVRPFGCGSRHVI